MKNYMDIFQDEDVFSGGSPKQKFFEIVYAANKNLVEDELDKLFQRFAAAEKLLEEHGLEEKLEQKVSSMNYEFDDAVENIKTSLYIETVGSIVSRNE
ncbi:MAG: DUF2018 family protein [Campylobacterota bacterium]